LRFLNWDFIKAFETVKTIFYDFPLQGERLPGHDGGGGEGIRRLQEDGRQIQEGGWAEEGGVVQDQGGVGHDQGGVGQDQGGRCRLLHQGRQHVHHGEGHHGFHQEQPRRKIQKQIRCYLFRKINEFLHLFA